MNFRLPMKFGMRFLLLLNVGALLLLASPTRADDDERVPRYPQGVYFIVGPGVGPTTASDFDTILSNSAISGLMVYVPWSQLNPNPPTSDDLPAHLNCHNLKAPDPSDAYDWSLTDAAFCAAESASPSKTIQLTVRPGFYTPRWVLDQINTNSCSGQFVFLSQPYYAPPSPLPPFPPIPTPGCHLAYFNLQEGGVVPLFRPLPVPWDSIYKGAWRRFLLALNARYGKNQAFVSISVGGPTADSDEILYPSGPRTNAEWSTLLQNQFSDPQYWKSDRAFIDEWRNAIDMYGEIFRDLTLELITAPGPPDFDVPFTVPSDARAFCAASLTMNCAAVYSIVSYFSEPGIGGPNAKAVANDALSAIPYAFTSVLFVKQLTESTAQSNRILGGAQSGGPFAVPTDPLSLIGFSCPDATASTKNACTPQQGFYNNLANFFDNTAGASLFPRLYDPATTSLFPGGTKTGPSPLNYLQMYGENLGSTASAVPVNTGVGPSPVYSGQDMLALASEGLALTAEQPLPVCESDSGEKHEHRREQCDDGSKHDH